MSASSVVLPYPVNRLRAALAEERERRGLRPSLTVPDFWDSMAHSTIRTQSGIVPFFPWPWQRELVDGITRREMALKARDVGSSEIFVRYYTWRMMRDGGNLNIKADKESNACNLLAMARHYLTSLPAGERPQIGQDNATRLELVGIGTIEALPQSGGRATRCKYLIMTERAFWGNSAEEIAAVTGSLVADGWQAVESTANGFNDFHAMWVDDQNGYRKTFAGREANPTHTANWWREKAQDLAGSPKQLRQEYPSTPMEAFIASGSTVFNADLAQAQRERCRPPLVVRDEGHLRIWQAPIPGQQCVFAADTAEGRDAGNDDLDSDAAGIWEWRTMRQIAALHGQWPPDVYAQKLYDLGAEYGYPMLAVERNNNSGGAVLEKLKALNYPNLYVHNYDEGDPLQLDHRPQVSSRPRRVLGWATNVKTKRDMETDFGALLAAGAIASDDESLWDEVLSYVHHGDGTRGAQRGCHDDRVMAAMIAVQLRDKWRPPNPPGMAQASGARDLRRAR